MTKNNDAEIFELEARLKSLKRARSVQKKSPKKLTQEMVDSINGYYARFKNLRQWCEDHGYDRMEIKALVDKYNEELK